MKYKLIVSLLCILSGFSVMSEPVSYQAFDKEGFYAVMASGNIARIDTELELVRNTSITEKDAYEGALLMRKSGLLKKAADKLKVFKAGRMKFDPVIRDGADNAEYRFLRLTIQEHAPRVVKYYKDQESDKQFIQDNFKNLPPVVQQAIREYSKTSKILRQEDF